jgi:protein SCO1
VRNKVGVTRQRRQAGVSRSQHWISRRKTHIAHRKPAFFYIRFPKQQFAAPALPLCLKISFVSTKALSALGLVVLLPLISYLLVKGFGDNAVQMPPRYFSDTVVNKVVDGKMISDTQWHRVANITLTNQLGKTVSLDDIKNKVIVVDFFFTRCPSICPGMTQNMRRLQDMMTSTDPRKVVDSALAHLVSFSIDPKRDSAAVLKAYADKHGVDHNRWWMLTGDRDEIYNFGIREMKLGMIDGNGVDTLFEHSPKFVLLDKDRVVRGYYNGLDTAQVLKLSQDIVFLSLEKNRKKPSALFTQMKNLWPVFAVVILAVFVFVIMNIRDRKKFNS